MPRPQPEAAPAALQAHARRPPRVLLAEDDRAMRQLLAAVLRQDGYDVVEAASGHEMVARLDDLLFRYGRVEPVELVISDVRMPGYSGLHVLASLRHADWSTPWIMITAFGDAATHAEAHRLGAAAVFDKPFDLDDLRTAVAYHVPADCRAQRGPAPRG